MLWLVFLSLVPELSFTFECHYDFDDVHSNNDRSGAFASDLWYWPHHRVYFQFDGSVIKEDRRIIWKVMREIEDNTCIKFVETRRPRYKYLTISTKKPYNCASCLLFGLNCPILNSGSVTSTPFCSKHFDCPYYYNSVTMRLKFTLPFCGNLSQRMKALITHELLHVLGLIHTQNRPDRDRYININVDAIDRRSMDQYMPKCYNCETYNLPYECDSLMHYGWMDFASSGRLLAFLQPTMTSRHSSCHLTSDGGNKATEADWEMARRKQNCGPRYNFKP